MSKINIVDVFWSKEDNIFIAQWENFVGYGNTKLDAYKELLTTMRSYSIIKPFWEEESNTRELRNGC